MVIFRFSGVGKVLQRQMHVGELRTSRWSIAKGILFLHNYIFPKHFMS